MRDSLRHAVAEFIGTFALVFVGGAAILHNRLPSAVGLLELALAHGLILAVMVSATMRVSGHLNPAVTLGFLATRRITLTVAGIYILAQLIGGMAGAYALRAAVPEQSFRQAEFLRLFISGEISGMQALSLEAIATFFLTFVIYGTAVDPRSHRVGGLAIGFTYAACFLAIGPLTGSALNPARALGPAVAAGGIWEGQFVWWFGPILGAIPAALLYDWLFLRRGAEPITHGPIDPHG